MSSSGARGHWSDGETSALIQAWGPMYVSRNGGSLHIAEWRRVCSAVNAHRAAAGRRFNRSLVQCQKRVYTLKDQYKKELAKGQPTSGWRHFAHLRAFLAGTVRGPPPGFAAKMPPASVKEEVEEMEVEASGSVGRTATAKEEVKKEVEELGREGPVSAGCSPAAVVTKLAEVYERVEMERLSVEKEKMAIERKKVYAEKTDDN